MARQGRESTPLLFRPRVPRRIWRLLNRGGTQYLTVQDTEHRLGDGTSLPDSPVARVRLTA